MKIRGILVVVGIVLTGVAVALGVIRVLGDSTKAPSSVQGVEMMVEPQSVTNEGLVFVIENKTNFNVEYGEEYWLEKRNVLGWNKVQMSDSVFWNAVLYVVTENSIRNCNLSWKHTYGNLLPGDYRLIKPITVDGTEYNIASEFKIP